MLMVAFFLSLFLEQNLFFLVTNRDINVYRMFPVVSMSQLLKKKYDSRRLSFPILHDPWHVFWSLRTTQTNGRGLVRLHVSCSAAFVGYLLQGSIVPGAAMLTNPARHIIASLLLRCTVALFRVPCAATKTMTIKKLYTCHRSRSELLYLQYILCLPLWNVVQDL